MADEGQAVTYNDVIEFTSDDRRVMTSHRLSGDGEWRGFMTAHHRRVKSRR